MSAESKHTPRYEVTSNGHVLSVSSNWRGYGIREMRQTLNSDGYPSVRIAINGKRKRVTVHALVARAYLPPRPGPDYEIRHLDGNKMNPCAENLAWGTRKDNANDRARHGKTSKGIKHSLAIKRSDHLKAVRLYHKNKKYVKK